MPALTQAQLELRSGVVVTITPLTPFALKVLNARALQEYPDPDPAPYEVEIEDALKPGTKTNAGDNPEYLRLYKQALQDRAQAYIGHVLDTACTVPDREALITQHGAMLTAMREAARGLATEAAFVSDYVVLLFTVLATEREVAEIVTLSQGARPLTDADIIDGIAFFRSVELQRQERTRAAQQSVTSRIQQAKPAPNF